MTRTGRVQTRGEHHLDRLEDEFIAAGAEAILARFPRLSKTKAKLIARLVFKAQRTCWQIVCVDAACDVVEEEVERQLHRHDPATCSQCRRNRAKEGLAQASRGS